MVALYPCLYKYINEYGLIFAASDFVGVDTFTSFVDAEYDHWVLPSYHIFVAPPSMYTLLPLMQTMPFVEPCGSFLLNCVAMKVAFTFPHFFIFADVLSSTVIISLLICALAVATENKQHKAIV